MTFVRPNWKDPSLYPGPDTSNCRWAWEFLRRNTEYAATWDRYAAQLRKAVEGVPTAVRWVEFELSAVPGSLGDEHHACAVAFRSIEREALDVFNPPRSEGEGRKAYLQRMADSRTRWSSMPLARALGLEWGIERIVNPAAKIDAFLPPLMFTRQKGVRMLYAGGLEEAARDAALDDEAGHRLILDIDLRWPTEVLIDVVGGLLRREQAARARSGLKVIKKRIRAEKYALYLRTLDGIAAGATLARVAEILHPHEEPDGREKKVRNYLKRANELCQHGYRELPMLAEAAKKARRSVKAD
jgi:hypothetical protein